MSDTRKYDRIREELRGIAVALCLVAVVTVFVNFIIVETGIGHGSVVYLIPVVIAATRWGIVPALVAAIGGVLASAYYFYPPLHSFLIKDPRQVLNLILFIFVAVVVSQLATRLKRQLETARQREIDLRDLYAFSRRLAVAFDVSDIHAAIEDHLANVMQRKVILFANAREASSSSGRHAGIMVPEPVLAEVVEVASGRHDGNSGLTVTADSGDVWLIRAVSPKSSDFGVIAINLGRASREDSDEMRIRVDAVLADATATLERLDVARAQHPAGLEWPARLAADQLPGLSQAGRAQPVGRHADPLQIGRRDALAGQHRAGQHRQLDQALQPASGRQAKAQLVAHDPHQDGAEAAACGIELELLDGDLGRQRTAVGERQAGLLEAQLEGLSGRLRR